jgi:hypothetical protein
MLRVFRSGIVSADTMGVKIDKTMKFHHTLIVTSGTAFCAAAPFPQARSARVEIEKPAKDHEGDKSDYAGCAPAPGDAVPRYQNAQPVLVWLMSVL